MANIVLPLNIDFMEWAAQIRIDLPDVAIPLPGSIDSWRFWACQVVNDNHLSFVPAPTGQTFSKNEDWKKWACYFVNSVYT